MMSFKVEKNQPWIMYAKPRDDPNGLVYRISGLFF